MNEKNMNIPKEKFQFAKDVTLHDKKLDTKPVGYFKDAFNRFKKNKGSLVAAFIILFLVLFALIAPIVSPYTVEYKDEYFAYCSPKSNMSEKFGWDFWDGCKEETVNESDFVRYQAMGEETGHFPIKNGKFTKYKDGAKNMYKIRLDTYEMKGVVFMNVTLDQYENIQKYQDETGRQVIYPITEKTLRPQAFQDEKDANYWFQTKVYKGKTTAIYDQNDQLIPAYKAYTGTDGYTSKVRIDGDENKYDYSIANETGKEIRIQYYEYYVYYHTYVLKDGIEKPVFWFGSTQLGQDIFTRLGGGAQLSFMIALLVSAVNMVVGAIYGAIEGYYGGKTDLIMERFSEILNAVPFMIVITLLKMHMRGSSQLLILFIAFFLTGWIGMAGTVRMQFYRFKNQEYVLAARTLGARDRRIMFKHIFPNSLGTIITSSVLTIPGMIFSESSLSYLGIINLNTGSMTSVGNMLSSAQPYLSTYPYMIVFPALFISLLMLSFNLFGNGLRDAFNPSLRGTEE